MKLKDIFTAAGNRLDWINFHWDWRIDDNGNVVPVMPVNINMNSDISVVYQWFHHFDPNLDTKDACNTIKNHDYNTFCKWFKMFEDDPWTYFPCEAALWVDDEYIGDVCVAYSEKLFSMITDQDHECG